MTESVHHASPGHQPMYMSGSATIRLECQAEARWRPASCLGAAFSRVQPFQAWF